MTESPSKPKSTATIISPSQHDERPTGQLSGEIGSSALHNLSTAAAIMRTALQPPSNANTIQQPPYSKSSNAAENERRDKTIAVGLRKLCRVFEKEFSTELVDDYFEAIEHVPPDLIELAVKRCIQRLKFMPRPAELLEQITEELDERCKCFNDELRERRFLLEAPPPRPAPTPEQLAAVSAAVAQATQAIAERQQTFVDEHDLEERRPRRLSEISAELAQRPHIPMPGEPGFG